MHSATAEAYCTLAISRRLLITQPSAAKAAPSTNAIVAPSRPARPKHSAASAAPVRPARRAVTMTARDESLRAVIEENLYRGGVAGARCHHQCGFTVR